MRISLSTVLLTWIVLSLGCGDDNSTTGEVGPSATGGTAGTAGAAGEGAGQASGTGGSGQAGSSQAGGGQGGQGGGTPVSCTASSATLVVVGTKEGGRELVRISRETGETAVLGVLPAKVQSFVTDSHVFDKERQRLYLVSEDAGVIIIDMVTYSTSLIPLKFPDKTWNSPNEFELEKSGFMVGRGRHNDTWSVIRVDASSGEVTPIIDVDLQGSTINFSRVFDRANHRYHLFTGDSRVIGINTQTIKQDTGVTLKLPPGWNDPIHPGQDREGRVVGLSWDGSTEHVVRISLQDGAIEAMADFPKKNWTFSMGAGRAYDPCANTFSYITGDDEIITISAESGAITNLAPITKGYSGFVGLSAVY